VLVPDQKEDTVDIEPLILKAINNKRNKGRAPYASGKTLVVFLNAGGGKWSPNKVAKQLPDPLYFAVVWVAGLEHVEGGKYIYTVTMLDTSQGGAPTWRIGISGDFTSWAVERIQ
jgi:hypothetical protein